MHLSLHIALLFSPSYNITIHPPPNTRTQALPQPDVFRHHALSAPLLHSYNEWRRHTTSKLESEPDAISSAPITLLLNNEKSLQLDVDKRRVLLEDGSYITYDKCLIATAGACVVQTD